MPGSEPAPLLNRIEVLRGLRISVWEAGCSSLWLALTTGAFLTGFALWLGANSLELGLVSAIPTFAGLVQIASSYFGERRTERRKFSAWLLLAGRLLWLPILAVPVIAPPNLRMALFLVLFALSYLLFNVPQPAFLSWIADLVPESHRGRFFARRNVVAGIAGLCVSLPAAWYLDSVVGSRHGSPLGFGVVFGLACVGALLSFACLMRQPEPPMRRSAPVSRVSVRDLVAYYRAPLADRNLRSLLGFACLFSIGQNLAAPFFNVYALNVLKLDYVWLQLFAALTTVTGLAAFPIWGYLSDRFGNRPLLALSVVGVSTLPLSWAIASPHHMTAALILLTELNLGSGFFWAGANLTQFNLLIGLAPPERTAVYVATMAAIIGIAGGLAPLAGSALMSAVGDWHGSLFGMEITRFQITFACAALFRIAALPALRGVVDSRSASPREVLQQLRKVRPRTLVSLRQMQRPVDEGSRVRAAERLAGSGSRLATAELLAALSDPSEAVRLEAAHALGEIGDPAGVQPLISAMRDPGAGLAEAAILSLGRIGDRRAVAPLASVLADPTECWNRQSRVAAARSLGRLGGPDAAAALLAALDTGGGEPEADVTEALVAALGTTGDSRAGTALTARLRREGVPASVRLALVRSLGELADPAAIPVLQDLIPAADSTSAPILADGLARLGDEDAAAPLFAKMQTLDSPIARKQVACAIGALIGEGETVYTLLAQEEFARDRSVTRLFAQARRRIRGSQAAHTLRTAYEAYTRGELSECARQLAQADEELATERTGAAPCQVCTSLLQLAGRGGATTEAVVLALVALRRAIGIVT